MTDLKKLARILLDMDWCDVEVGIAKGKFFEAGAIMRRYRSKLSAAIHETSSDLVELGQMDKKTLREFDESCLVKPHQFSPEEIKAIREREHVSQAVFARYLNVTKNLISDWERGVKRPGGPAMLLLALVEGGGLARIYLGD